MSKESVLQSILQQKSASERTHVKNISAEEILFLITGKYICFQESLSTLKKSAMEM